MWSHKSVPVYVFTDSNARPNQVLITSDTAMHKHTLMRMHLWWTASSRRGAPKEKQKIARNHPDCYTGPKGHFPVETLTST